MELGRKGGNARAKSRGWENIPEKARKESARKAAQARWAKVNGVPANRMPNQPKP